MREERFMSGVAEKSARMSYRCTRVIFAVKLMAKMGHAARV